MRKATVIALASITLLLLAFSRKPAGNFAIPDGWPKPAYDFRKHPLTAGKVALGRRLFYEPGLSRDSTISCSSCHLSYTGFTHIDHNLSHGIRGRIGIRNSPALQNLAWSSSFMWDGAVAHIDEQAQKPVSNPLEMDESMGNVVRKLNNITAYRAAFYDAFADSAITAGALQQALGQFMLTLVSANAKYDKVMRGETTFTAREAHGYELFKANCASCHTEPLFTNGGFENNGLRPDSALNDMGRMKITGRPADSLKFKVPSLRNVEVTYPYMHDGRFRNLQMVLFHYTESVMQSPTLSPELRRKLNFTEQDKNDIVLFLKTLTDEQFLKNPDFQYKATELITAK